MDAHLWCCPQKSVTKVVHKDRRAAMLQKARENDNADSEFSEGRRNAFINGGDNLFFAGSDIPGRKLYDTRRK